MILVVPFLGWLLDAAVKAAIILVLAAGVTLALRRASAALRHLVWSLAVGCALALPLLSLVLPAWQVKLLPQVPSPTHITQSDVPTSPHGTQLSPLTGPTSPPPPLRARRGKQTEAAGAMEKRGVRLPQAAVASTSRSLPQDLLPSLALVIWALGALAALMPTLIGRLHLLRIRKQAHPVADAGWLALAREGAGALGLRRPVVLLSSHQALIPMVWGCWRPVLLLPAEAEAWSLERKRLVLLHELAHVKRADCLTQLLGQLACALYWFNPLVWVAAHRMRVERERACDDLILNAGFRPSDYAGQLLEIAQTLRRPGFASAAAIAMARQPGIESRIRAILDAGRNRRGVGRWARLAAMLAVAAVALPLACARGVHAPPQPQPALGASPGRASRAASTWRITRPSGVTVELIGIGYSPSKGRPWWKPDGSPAPTPPGVGGLGSGSPVAREVAFRASGVSKQDGAQAILRWRFPGASDRGSSASFSEEIGESTWEWRFLIDDQRTATIPQHVNLRLRVADGPWEARATRESPRGLAAYGYSEGGFILGSLVTLPGKRLQATGTTDADPNHYDLRLVAVTKTGKTVAYLGNSSSAGKVTMLEYTFDNLVAADVKEVRFQTRPYTWIEFPNVAFNPASVSLPAAKQRPRSQTQLARPGRVAAFRPAQRLRARPQVAAIAPAQAQPAQQAQLPVSINVQQAVANQRVQTAYVNQALPQQVSLQAAGTQAQALNQSVPQRPQPMPAQQRVSPGSQTAGH